MGVLKAAIELRGVGLRRERAQILRDVDWRVEAGEHWALVGENGAGKTSLLEIVMGYLWPTTGSVEVLGARYGEVDLREHRTRIGWVGSSFSQRLAAVRPDETAIEVVVSGERALVGLWQAPTEEQRAAARSVLEALGRGDLAGRPFRTLSQGEQQTVLLARMWMARADLLILDEPCTGLDLRAREQVLEAVGRLAQEGGPTLLYVTHHVEEILPAFTHALLLKGGRVLAAGPKEGVLTGRRLSEAFEIGLDVRWQAGRPWVAVVS